MQDVCTLGYISINFTISFLKFIVVLLILSVLTALINLLLVLNLLNISPYWLAIDRRCFLLFMRLTIFLINSAASSGLSTFFASSLIPLLSIGSLIIDSRNFSKILLLPALYVLLVSPGSNPMN